jgi:hypothetical protein
MKVKSLIIKIKGYSYKGYKWREEKRIKEGKHSIKNIQIY